jgi:hypothetical protein
VLGIGTVERIGPPSPTSGRALVAELASVIERGNGGLRRYDYTAG